MSSSLIGTIPVEIRAEIDRRIAAIKAEEDVRLLAVVESGSRAWGFPSPDSDFDVRFIYARKRDWYLSLVPGRDVIERPIDDEIDLSGWDIRKALGLLLKSNAVVSEWIESPIRYIADDPVIARIAALADDVLDGRALAYHYANLGRRAADRWLDGDGDVPVKKYFYALRPAIAILSILQNDGKRPPMNLQQLMASCDLSPPLIADIDELVEAKKRTNEWSNGMRKPALDTFIREQLDKAPLAPRKDKDGRFAAAANTIFLELINT
jgi:predicted nucleotidyltransferase